jgi:ABC-2 type transport system permease protein
MKLFIGFIKKEFAQTLRDPVMRMFVFGAPILQLLVFGSAISNEFGNLRLSSVYQPINAVARQVTDRFYASGYFVPGPAAGYAAPDELLRSGTADAVLIFSDTAHCQLLIAAQNATKARAVENYARQILAMSVPAARGGVSFSVRVLFNPSMQTAIFMVPGVMTLILCLMTVILTAMSLAREKEMGTFESIIAAPLRKRQIILGKTVPFVIIGIIDAIIVITAGVILFDVPIRGPIILLAAATAVFICTTITIGTLISTIAQTQQQAMMGAFLFVFPAVLMSGIMFPIENMPVLIRLLTYLNPLTYFTTILRNVMLKGANTGLVLQNLAVMIAMTAAIIALAIRRFRQTLN